MFSVFILGHPAPEGSAPSTIAQRGTLSDAGAQNTRGIGAQYVILAPRAPTGYPRPMGESTDQVADRIAEEDAALELALVFAEANGYHQARLRIRELEAENRVLRERRCGV